MRSHRSPSPPPASEPADPASASRDPVSVESIHVDLGPRSYDIIVGEGLLERVAAHLAAWVPEIAAHPGRAAAVVTDSHVAPHARIVEERLKSAGWRVGLSVVEPGETSKSLAAVSALYDDLVALNADRRTPVIAVGGGVVGDLAGFAAATFNRGLPLVQAPTSLLADVDSSVGGKVGVNHPRAKNLIGAFHQPRGVLIDVDCLQTLPGREHRSVLAEVVKYGVILDAEFFAWLEASAEALVALEPAAVRRAILRSCRLKADVVELDEFEHTGLRAKLNYGHTFAHAFEALAGYGELLHGEAVALGMLCASRLAERIGRLDAESTRRQQRLLERCELPTEVPAALVARGDELLACMRLDKKSIGSTLRFVLPSRIGHVDVVEGVRDGDVLAALQS